MRRLSTMVMAVLAAVFISGCGGNSEAVAQRALDSMKAMTAALESGNREQILEAGKNMQVAVKDLKQAKTTKRVTDKYTPLITAELARMKEVRIKVVASGKVKQADLNELETILKD